MIPIGAIVGLAVYIGRKIAGRNNHPSPQPAPAATLVAPPLGPLSEAENMRLYGVPVTVGYDYTKPPIELNQEQLRQLATGRLLLLGWGLSLKQLMPVTPEIHQHITTMLKRDWGVETAAELPGRIRSLLQKGHRATLQPQLAQNEAYWRAKFDEHALLRTLPVRSVAGWDFGRVVCLAYWGLLVDMISVKTAFTYMEEATDMARQHLHSWQDLAASYLAGRVMWRPQAVDDMSEIENYARTLLEHPQSVWRLVPWA